MESRYLRLSKSVSSLFSTLSQRSKDIHIPEPDIGVRDYYKILSSKIHSDRIIHVISEELNRDLQNVTRSRSSKK